MENYCRYFTIQAKINYVNYDVLKSKINIDVMKTIKEKIPPYKTLLMNISFDLQKK